MGVRMSVNLGRSQRADEEGTSPVKFPTGVALVLVTLPLLVLVTGTHRSTSLDWFRGVGSTVRTGPRIDSSPSSAAPVDRLLGGLLAPAGFDEQSCLSRYQSAIHHKASPHLPSHHLVERLRRYEALHKKCRPGTELYKKSAERLKSNHSTATECNYVVWTPFNGLGNRMLTLASTFLFALLTNRVMLVHLTDDLKDLFCEHFPGTSWVLPSDFPIEHLDRLDIGAPQSYGNMIRRKAIDRSSAAPAVESLPAYMYHHLIHDYNDFDKLFFCEEDQLFLARIPWLVLKSDNYFVPALFLIPAYEGELSRLFTARETVFHHLGRYLLHPTNAVWGMIKRYYGAYLAKANERVGIQIRIFPVAPISSDNMLEQVLNCSRTEKLLPETSLHEPAATSATDEGVRSKAILVTSLYAEFSEKIMTMYYEHPAASGEFVAVHQPSHEGTQQTEKQTHNQKALAEMYLLSYSDVLVTTAWSTFGYIAQGLSGLKPWFLLKPEDGKAPDPPCVRAKSLDPCFHSPPTYDCKAKKNIDTGKVVPHVRHCEDVERGLKLFD